MRENKQQNSDPETVNSHPEAFLESGSETRMLTILLLWKPSLKYFSILKEEHKTSKRDSGTSVESTVVVQDHQ